jgi:hypothetical protein
LVRLDCWYRVGYTPIHKKGTLVLCRRGFLDVSGRESSHLVRALTPLDFPAREIRKDQNIGVSTEEGCSGSQGQSHALRRSASPEKLRSTLRVGEVFDRKSAHPAKHRILGHIVLDHRIDFRWSLPAIARTEYVRGMQGPNECVQHLLFEYPGVDFQGYSPRTARDFAPDAQKDVSPALPHTFPADWNSNGRELVVV